ncbi:MAG: response regulator transcription factor [Turicibacter sp.]
MAKILIVEDEELINDLIKENLILVGHDCIQAFDGQEVIHLLRQQAFDLIILDIMMPKVSGYEVLNHRNDVPVMMLTAKDNVMDKVKTLNQGAEDYLVKPFDMLELIARVNVILRRYYKESKVIKLDNLYIDLASKLVKNCDQYIELTPKEYELLEVLLQNKNIALSRERLIEIVWGYEYEGDTRTVDVHIASLRKKLKLENRIKTVYKLGYRLEL